MKRRLIVLLASTLLLLQGCESINSRPRYKYKVGMDKEQVLGSIDGEPRKRLKTTTAYGTTEIWVYAGPSYLHFDERGILRRIDSPF